VPHKLSTKVSAAFKMTFATLDGKSNPSKMMLTTSAMISEGAKMLQAMTYQLRQSLAGVGPNLAASKWRKKLPMECFGVSKEHLKERTSSLAKSQRREPIFL
jgi:hypothetical protein